MAIQTPQILWQPSESFIQNSNISDFTRWLKSNKNLIFSDYDKLWEWSVEHIDEFWQVIFEYFEVIHSGNYSNVVTGDLMPNISWFEGVKLNYAEHIFRKANHEQPAIIFKKEGQKPIETSWDDLKKQVASVAEYLESQGVEKGDRVVAYLPSIPEATVAFLATCSLGAVWSSCSPDFGAKSVIDRFKQIEPKVLFTVDGYSYNGKDFDKTETVEEILKALKNLKSVVQIPYLQGNPFLSNSICVLWEQVIQSKDANLTFERVDFNDPIWVLYSSGTTGTPKAITHSQGGVLLEHLKYVTFHNDVKQGEKYFWFTTTGWMMWNFVQGTMLAGATIVLYDGSPGYPDLSALWEFASDCNITHFGTSAPFILACSKSEIVPSSYDLSSLRSISSTGSPLPPEGFLWIYQNVKRDLWFCSMSGGTDVCSAFVGGVPSEPVFEGEIQRRTLGCSLFAYDDDGNRLGSEVGEMVIEKPMPSMPIYFWNDLDKSRYKDSYFGVYPQKWRHGDWVQITDRNTVLILGRSDATLNRHGIRIGSAEIYQAVDKVEEIVDSLVVNVELPNGNHHMPLFVLLPKGQFLNEMLINQINNQLRSDFSSRHVPDAIIQVENLPYTMSGKKMETVVKKILMGTKKEIILKNGGIKNPTSLNFFTDYYGQMQLEN